MITKETMKNWANSFNVSSFEDVENELFLMNLEFENGLYKPSFDWNERNDNLGLVYTELSKRLGEQQISVGRTEDFDTNADEDEAFYEDEGTFLNMELEDALYEIDVIRNTPLDVFNEIFDCKKRRFNYIKQQLIGNVIKKAAAKNGLSEECYASLKSSFKAFEEA